MRIDSPQIVGNLSVAEGSEAVLTGSFTGSFTGDGSGITGVTAEWDGSHTGNASITGDLAVTGEVSAATFVGDGSGLTNVAPLAGAGIDVTGTTVSVDATIATAADLQAHTINVTNPHNVTKTQLGLGSVDNTSDANKPISTAQQAALNLKAPLADPTFTGTVTVPTQLTSDDSTKAATTAYVTDKIQEVVAAAPAALDTLNELAAAIGDDANFAGTVTTSLGEKLAKASNLSDLTNAATARGNLGLGSLATLSTVNASTITDNSVGAAELNVSGNGTTAQFLRSDGDGTFSWVTPTDTNTTYTAGNGLTLSGTEFLMSGNYTGTFTATGDIVAYSDERLKKDVSTIEGALDKTKQLRGVEFTRIADDARSIGVIAQELEKVIPELVITDDEGIKGVNYAQITGLLIEAVKELSAKVEALESK